MMAEEAASKSPTGHAERWDEDGYKWIFTLRRGGGFRTTDVKDRKGEPLFRMLTEEQIQSADDWTPIALY